MKLITEFVGTFLFLLVISLSGNAGPLAPVAIGGALMIMVYMGGHVSGAHYNPAVSLAVLMRGKMTSSEFLSYALVQVVAGLAAFATGYWLSGMSGGIAPGPEVDAMKALGAEIVFTFALAMVVLNVATAKQTAGNSFYGLAIGFTIVVAAFVAGPISGGAFNPAVGIGASLSKAMFAQGELKHMWIYVIGPFVGAALAALVFKAQNPEADAE